jgi:hypothetical protein
MKNALRIHVYLTLSVLCFGLTLPLLAQTTIYNNSTNDLLIQFNPGTTEVGNEIVLAGTDRFLTGFSFEYWGSSTKPSAFAGHIMAEVRFYLNNGPLFNNTSYASPNAIPFYDSTFAVPAPIGRGTFVFGAADFLSFNPSSGGALYLPANLPTAPNLDMTWTVQFSGMGAGDSVGLDLYGPPTVGGNYGDYWLNSGGWQLMTNSVAPPNGAFAADMIAVATVPEPSTLALSVLGGLGLLVVARRLGRKE